MSDPVGPKLFQWVLVALCAVMALRYGRAFARERRAFELVVALFWAVLLLRVLTGQPLLTFAALALLALQIFLRFKSGTSPRGGPQIRVRERTAEPKALPAGRSGSESPEVAGRPPAPSEPPRE